MSKEKKQYDKILVVAQTADKVVRYKFENQLVQDFALLGIKAIPSKEVIHSDLFEKELSEQDIETLKNQLKQDGYSGVVVTNLINTNNYADVVSGGVSTGYLPVRYGRFRSYYQAYPVSYWEQDQVETGVEYTLESCLYDIRVDTKDNLQWVGSFKVKDPQSVIKTIEKYSLEYNV